MKNLKHKTTGEQIQVHEVDARDLVNGGLYEDLGTVPTAGKARVMTVAELAGVKTRAEAVAVKVNVTDLPEFKAAVESASKRIAELEAQAVVNFDRIAELEVLLEGATKPKAPALDKATLLARAVELKVAAPSTMERWGAEKLAEAIAEAEKAI